MIYIALLRGINVGGHKKVPMAELRAVLSNSGLDNVQTYIQSGNVIFDTSEISTEKLETKIHNSIKDHFGYEVSIILKKPQEIQSILDRCPFEEGKKEKSYFVMLHNTPGKELVEEASKKEYPNEAYFIIGDCIYFFCATGVGKAKFNSNFFERKLKTTSTTRNYNTMMKLLSLSAER